MTVGKGAGKLERIGGGDEGFSFQDAAEEFDLVVGPVGEVGEGAFADFAVFTPALTEEDGGGRLTIGDGLDVHGNRMSHLVNTRKYCMKYDMGTNSNQVSSLKTSLKRS